MSGSVRAIAVFLAVLAPVTLTPATVLAQRAHTRAVGPVGGAGGRAFISHGVAPRSFSAGPRSFSPGPFAFHRHDHRFFHRGVPFAVFAPPVVIVPPLYYSTSLFPGSIAYDDPPATYSAPVTYAPPPRYAPPPPATATVSVGPAPMPSVVEYASGRYELRGDGLTIPYTWVWIPNPPPAPPPMAPSLPASAPSPPAPDSSSRHGQLYRWTDEEGVVHWTDNRESVPEQYRKQAKRPRTS